MGQVNQELVEQLRARASNGENVLRSIELKSLFDELKTLPPEDRGTYGKQLNELRAELEQIITDSVNLQSATVDPVDVTAPFDVNVPDTKKPKLLPTTQGSVHPVTSEIAYICDIFARMGFVTVESREIDDDYHMFGSLNFPEGHSARDDYDTFMTDEGWIAPAHTSTMQNRVLKQHKPNLDVGEPIAAVIPGRVFRNEDVDPTHEHTFYQIEGVYVGQKVTVGNLVAVLKTYMSEYFEQDLNIKIQPFYFPFTEPSFEFAIERPDILRKNDSEAEKWLELGGCGMIHPNVLKEAGIDPTVYTGFAWGFGIERMVMMKKGVEDVRHFESGKLEFLRQF